MSCEKIQRFGINSGNKNKKKSRLSSCDLMITFFLFGRSLCGMSKCYSFQCVCNVWWIYEIFHFTVSGAAHGSVSPHGDRTPDMELLNRLIWFMCERQRGIVLNVSPSASHI